MYEHRNFVIFDVTELPQIDFSQVLQTSSETVRRSVDGTKTFVKWDNGVPACVERLTTKSRYYTYDEMLEILATSEWTASMETV